MVWGINELGKSFSLLGEFCQQSVYGRPDRAFAMAFTLACPVVCGVYGVVYNWSGRPDVCKDVKFPSLSVRNRCS